MNSFSISDSQEVLTAAQTNIPKQEQAKTLSVIFPKQNQKVRGPIRIYGKAKPKATVKLYITSTYYKTKHQGQKIIQGEGPLKRMNRLYNIVADKNGVWAYKEDLRNAGWEENFTIKAVSEGSTVTVKVYDNTRPIMID
ncbi:MAG: hypothetical protein EOP53_20405 [Sphingobacteriales bacterium]|nr:MAG: hypothetical protein EOP53_20405 [Sphingobacteriales bacterium]